MTENTLIKEMRTKRENLIKAGINSYPYKYTVKDTAEQIQKKHKNLKSGEKTNTNAQLAGRVMLLRRMGKVTFLHIQDRTGRIQIYLKEKETKDYNNIKNSDIGDIIGVKGKIFKTQKGEITIQAEEYTFLTKAIHPLPEKFHGIKDQETRYRKRYVDLIMNPEVTKVFEARAKIIQEMRNILTKKGFTEVEIPTLQPVYGGAEARPFITHLNSLDMDIYLQISPELYLKRLIIGGMEKVFTIGKNFRNEGIDATHNPEFTMMECYEAYTDYNDVMDLTEEMIETICKRVVGKTKVQFGEMTIEFKRPWKRIPMIQAIKEYANIDVTKYNEKELKKIMQEKGYETGTDDEMINILFEECVEKKLIQPTFITDYPLTICPLTKVHRKNNKLVERFELFINGTEVANAYSELNDPDEQKERFKIQEKRKEKGNEEAHPTDTEFIKALEYGMPPCGGLGIGIDRLVMFLTNKQSIRDVILFPFMKPETTQKKK